MRFSEFTGSKLNEVAPAVAGAVVGGVTFTAAEITALTLGLGLSAMMLQYNADPEAFEAAHGAAAAAVANSWQATKDMASSLMGGDENPVEAGKSIDELSREATSAMTAHLTQLTPEQQAKSSEEINNYLTSISGTTSTATQTLTPAQRNAISAMPTIASALPNSIVSDRTAEIIAQVDKAADAQAAATAARSAEISAQVDREADARKAAADATASTNAVRPEVTPAGMPAAPAAKAQQLTPTQRNAISDMPTAPNVDVDITKDIPKSDNKDVDITSDIPAITTPDVDITSGIPDIAPPGAVTAPPGAIAKPKAVAKPNAVATPQATTRSGTGKGKGKGKMGLPSIGGGASTALKSIKPTLLQINDPLNLKRNIQ